MRLLRRLTDRYPEVQLATLVDTHPAGDPWLHEIKLDGYRLLGFVADQVARLRTRNGKDWTSRFPVITEALEALKVREAVVDLEAVVLSEEDESNFQALQAALGANGNAQQIIGYAFDLLHLDGKDLTSLPLTDRKKKLEKLLAGSGQKMSLLYGEHITGSGAEMFAKACETGLEGIISKQADAPYVGGRQKSWLKIKCSQRQEFIIIGSSTARTGERALGALYLAYRQGAKLRYAGKVGTGFSLQSARELMKRFEKLAVNKPLLTRAEMGALPMPEWRSIRWLKPVLLCEASFTERTQDGRIPSSVVPRPARE